MCLLYYFTASGCVRTRSPTIAVTRTRQLKINEENCTEWPVKKVKRKPIYLYSCHTRYATFGHWSHPDRYLVDFITGVMGTEYWVRLKHGKHITYVQLSIQLRLLSYFKFYGSTFYTSKLILEENIERFKTKKII